MNITNCNNDYRPTFGYFYFTKSAQSYLGKLGKVKNGWEKFDELRETAKSCEHCVYVDVARGRLDAQILAYGVAHKPIGYRIQRSWESQLNFLKRMHKLSIKNGKRYDQRKAEKARLEKLQRERFPLT